MWKAVLAGTTALALAGTSIVYAQQRSDRGRDGFRRGPASIEDMRAFGDARLAALKAGLQLNADQEKNWPAFEQAARELAKLRFDRMAATRDRLNAQRQVRQNQARQNGEQGQQAQQTTVDPIERLRQRGTTMAETGNALKKLADATDPLYKSLDDNQKRRFAVLGRMGAGRFDRHHGERRGMERGGNRHAEMGPERFNRGSQYGQGQGRWHDRFERGQRGGDRSGSSDYGTGNL